MRYLGLDVGDKRIGLAISDALGYLATPLQVYHRVSKDKDIENLGSIAEEVGAEALVVGLPRNMNGTYGERAESVKKFADKLELALSLPVYYFDERLTTMAAERVLLQADMSRKKRKKVIDKLAAQIILQGFLDSQQRKE